VTPAEVLDFWFAPDVRRHWFRATPDFDALLRDRFEAIWLQAREGGCDHWADSAPGALALVILFDQFPLNMYRDQALGFVTEARSREVAAGAIARGWDAGLADEQRAFLYLPFMHSETLADQDRSVALFAQAGLTDNLRWARHHREIVRRFGRFPHRNAVLGRDSSAEELAWLASAGAYNP